MSAPAIDSVSENLTCTDLYAHRTVARVLFPLAYSIICPVGVLGNALALHAIFCNLAKLNSSTLYSANLAVSDLLLCLALPIRGLYYALGFHWPLGEGLCKVTALLFYVNCYAGVNFMTCLAVDRFVAVALRPKLAGLRNMRNVKLICLMMWLVVLAQTLPLLSMPMTNQEPDGTITCMEYPNFEHKLEGLPYMLIGAVVLGFGIPLGTILICYSVLSRRLWLAAKANRLTERSGRTHKARTVIAGVVLVFVVCFSPYHVDLLQYMIRKLAYEPDCDELRSFQISLHVTVCLMNFNSCLDPFVYFFACKGYKRKVLMLLKRKVNTSITSAGHSSHESSGTQDQQTIFFRGNSHQSKLTALNARANSS
ncbi:G-protein coupled receptor 183-B [Trichomycterus rosablanca]|uniref:G-protein coupled receptor 183-B n=1 Tax=Trichomycterus rosablanca TaxID=2290929 RepID=UPI002F35D6B1